MKKFLILVLIFYSCTVVENNRPIKSPLIVLTFDDGHRSIYELAFPVMQKFGYVGVNFIPTGWINQSGILSLDELHLMEAARWETGGHSITHANLTTIPIDSAEYEIKNNYLQLIEFGLKHRCFALPAGHSNPEVDKIIKKYFQITRTSYNERYNYPLDINKLGYYQVEANDDVSSLLMRITHGITEEECLTIIGFHQFCNGNPSFICMTDISVFESFLSELKKRNLRVVTLSNAVDILLMQ